MPGGVASSCVLKNGLTINDQVQGGSSSYRHNLQLLKKFGFEVTPVDMKISFGVGAAQWTNTCSSPLTDECKSEIKRFGQLLKRISALEAIYVLFPIQTVLRWEGYSAKFQNEMVFPLVALFFGTGNQTPHVSAAVIARVFLDPDLRLFDYCEERLLASVPKMFSFPVLEEVFQKISNESPYTLHCNRGLHKVTRKASAGWFSSSVKIIAEDTNGVVEEFDDIIFACDAETVLKTLVNPTWLERRLIGNVKYYDDFAITHEDSSYMKNMYDIKEDNDSNYFTRSYESDPTKIEMSFDLCTYQPHLKAKGASRIYQTYYLDANAKGLWTDGAVEASKTLTTRWMRQFAHTWTHFATWVPWGRFIQGTRNTLYAGSWTLFNTQEIAVMSGIAAAVRLGASYPFPSDPLACKQFDMLYGLVHGLKRRK